MRWKIGLVALGLALMSQGAAAFTYDYDLESEQACRMLNANKAPQETIATCTTAFEKNQDPDVRAMALTQRGVAYRQLGQNGKSLKDLRAAKRLDAKPNTLRMLAWTWHELGYDKTAEWIYTRVLKQDDAAQGWLSRCVVRIDLEKNAEAAKDCHAALSRDPESEDAAYFGSLALINIDQPKHSMTVAQNGLKYTDSARLHLNLAMAMALSGDVVEARAYAKSQQSKFPNEQGFQKLLTTIEGY